MLSTSEVRQEQEPPDTIDLRTSKLRIEAPTLESTISSKSTVTGKKQPVCRYFRSKQECPFGDQCRYRHSEIGPDRAQYGAAVSRNSQKNHRGRQQPVCRHFLASHCRYGDKCKFYHPASQSAGTHTSLHSSDQEVTSHSADCHPSPSPSPPLNENHSSSMLLDAGSFPSLHHGSSKHITSSPSEVTARYAHHQHNPAAPSSNRSKHEHGPPPLSLDAFFQRSKVIHPKPAVSRPQPHWKGTSTADLRQMELQQLETRFPGDQCCLVEKGRERTVYCLKFSPTDPDSSFLYKSLKSVDLLVTFPADYPSSLFIVEVCEDQQMPASLTTFINTAMAAHINTMDKGREQRELMLRPFLHWLDRSIVTLFRDAMKEVRTVSMFATGWMITIPQIIQTVSAGFTGRGEYEGEEELKGYEEEEIGKEEEEGKEEKEEEQEESASDEDISESDEEPSRPYASSLPAKRGTEIRFHDMSMSKGVGTVRCEGVKLMIQCTRCRTLCDVNLKVESPSAHSCSRCHTTFSLVYHPSIMHPGCSTVGFLDLMGCTPIDLVLIACEIVIVCLECGRDNPTRGLSYGQSQDIWCRRCHSLLTLAAEQSKFINHQPGLVDVPLPCSLPTSTTKKGRARIFKVGEPLPETGTCAHYKKSHRWLRFPCCGKAYPCDVCHDTSEDHPMERANRMICGYCSKEQPYAGFKPCVLCGGDLAYIKGSVFWEGGMGCRNKTKMSRNDPHKFSNSAQKTSSKKQDRVGHQIRNKPGPKSK